MPGMTDNADIQHRRSIRLKKYDYRSKGVYFVTICAQEKRCLFGEIVDDKMTLSEAGRVMENAWNELPRRFNHIELDTHVIMPNHIHGIIPIVGAPLVGARNRAGTRPAPTPAPSLGDIVGAFKSITTNEYINGVKQHGWPPFPGKLWQRNYYEHIVRNDDELNAVREYIVGNPLKWAMDRENPNRQLRPTHCCQ